VSAKEPALLRAYQQDLGSYASPRTVESFLSAVKAFLSWTGERGLTLIEIRTADLEAYRAALQSVRQQNGKPYSISTQAGYLVSLKSFFRFLCRHGYALHDPAANLELPRRDKRLPRVLLSPAEVRRMLEGIRERSPIALRDRALIETLYATGLRVSELTHLTLYDVDTEERVVRVILGKGGRIAGCR